MYKLVIMEDEWIEREGLVSCMDWGSLNIEVAGVASDGLESLLMCYDLKPDIIITDINMPGMSGLEVLGNIRTALPDVKSIIISGHNNFEFAREALQLNAFSYILKPFEEAELLAILQEIVEALDQKAEERQIINRYSRDKLLLQLMTKSGNMITDIENLKSANRLLSGSLLNVFILNWHSESEYEALQDSKKRLQKMLEAQLGQSAIVIHPSEENKLIVVYAQTSLEDFETTNERICLLLKANADSRLIAGFGKITNDLHELSKSYDSANIALDQQFFLEDRFVIFYEDTDQLYEQYMVNKNKTSFIINSSLNKIRLLVRSVDLDNTSLLLDELFDFLRVNYVPAHELKLIFTKFIYDISFILYEINEENSMICGREEEMAKLLGAIQTLSQLRIWFYKLINDIIQNIEEGRAKRRGAEPLAQKMVEIITNNYMHGISIKTISDEIQVSANYLGALFKKSTGKSFTDFLNHYRIEKAKEFLSSGTYKIAKVAEMAGIPNESYFCSVFKHVVGISPGKYMELNDKK